MAKFTVFDYIQIIFFVIFCLFFAYAIISSWNKFQVKKPDEFQWLNGFKLEPLKRRKKGNKSKFELKCKAIAEEILGREGKSIRPPWLKYPKTGRNLEIDIYFDDIKTELGRGVGIEADGQTHHQYTPHFHRKGPQQFLDQVERDQWKDKTCQMLGIYMIRVPIEITDQDIGPLIKSELLKAKAQY